MAFCKNCGAQVNDSAKFCRACGTARTPGLSAVATKSTPHPASIAPLQWTALLRVILKETGRRFLKGLPFTLAIMAAIGAGMYFYNLYVIGWLNDGWRFSGAMNWLGFHSGTTNGAGGINPLGFLFGGTGAALTLGALWFIVPTLLIQFLRKGPAGTIEDWLKAPVAVQRYFAQSGRAATAELCVGAGTGLVIGACAFGYSSLALAAGLGLFLGTQGSRVVSLLVSAMWSATYAKLSGPANATKPGQASGFIVMLGGIGGLLVRQLFPTGVALVAGLALLCLALYSTRGGLSRAMPLLTFIILVCALVFAPSLFADDGGFVEWARETGNPQTFDGFLQWLRQTGQAGNVRDLALLHALYTAAVGGGVGGWWRALGQLPPELANQFQPPTVAQQEKQSQPRTTAKPEPKPDPKPDPKEPKPPKRPKTDPSLVDPYTGEPLVVNDGSQAGGKPGQVKFGDRWMDREEASELIADNQRAIANRDQQRQQFLDESRRSSDALMEKLARPEPEPASTEPDVAQKLNRMRDLGDKTLANVTDPAERDFMRNFLDRHSNDPEAMRRAIHAIQTHNSANTDDYLAQAEWWNGATETAADTRDWANTVNRGLARFVPGGGLVVQAQGLVTGAVDAYEQGGLTGAGGKTLATLADNALSRGLGIPTGGIISTIYNNGGDMGKSAKEWSDQYNPADYLRRLNEVRTKWPDNPMDGIRSVLDTGLDAADARDDFRDGRDAYHNRGTASSDQSPSSPPPQKPDPSTSADTPPAGMKTTRPTHTSDGDPAALPPTTPDAGSATQPPTRSEDTPATTPEATPPKDEVTRPPDDTPQPGDKKTARPGDEATPPGDKDSAQPKDESTPQKDDATKPPLDDERQANIERERERQRLQEEGQRAKQEGETPPQKHEQPQQQPQADAGGDGDDRINRLKQQRDDAAERLGEDHPIVKGIDERIRDANPPPKVDILDPDDPKHRPVFGDDKKVPDQGANISAEEARRREFIVRGDGTVERGANNPVDHVRPRESVIQVDPVTGTRTVIHGPDVPQNQKQGIAERLNRQLDEKIKIAIDEDHARQQRIKDQSEKLVKNADDAPPRTTTPPKDDATTARPDTPPVRDDTTPPKDESTKSRTDPPPVRDDTPSPDKDAPPPKDEAVKPPVDEHEARLESRREKQRLQMEEQKRKQQEQQGNQAIPQVQQQPQAKHGGDGGGDGDSAIRTETDTTADPTPATPPSKEVLKQLRNDFETRVRGDYWKEYARQIRSGEVGNPFGDTAIPANPKGNVGGSAPADNLRRMERGDPPIGSDGLPVQLHHKVPLKAGGTNDHDNLLPFTQTTHSRASRILHKEPHPGNQWQGEPGAGDIKPYGASRRTPKTPAETQPEAPPPDTPARNS